MDSQAGSAGGWKLICGNTFEIIQAILFSVFLIFLGFFSFSRLKGQERSPHAILSLGAQQSTQKFLPFYHHSYQGGILRNKKAALWAGLQAHYEDSLWNSHDFLAEGEFSGYMTRDQNRQFWIQNAYLGLSHPLAEILVGKVPYIRTKAFPDYPIWAWGDLALSPHAEPIPKLGLQLNTPSGFRLGTWHLHVRHGWLENARPVRMPYWHERSLWWKFQPRVQSPWILYAGVQHHALWGGSLASGERLHKRAEDVFKVLFFQPGEDPNVAGSHLVFINIGSYFKFSEVWGLPKDGFTRHVLHVFYQLIAEDKSGLQFANMRNGLFRASLQNNSQYPLALLGYEYLNTSQQSGPGLPDPTSAYPSREANYGYPFGGRDNIYNNYLYPRGYTYRGLVIGDPVYLTALRSQQIGLDLDEHADGFILSNRIRAHRVYLATYPWPDLSINLNYTRATHLGSYFGRYEGRYNWDGQAKDPDFPYFFSSPKVQHHIQLRLEKSMGWAPLSTSLSFAWDGGDMYRNSGIMAGLRYMPFLPSR
ncbi:MAG: hypothetical protein OXB93_01230 [Cytophagales bacterium]|nr:hypothetical protein [Cytophagales bacterium]